MSHLSSSATAQSHLESTPEDFDPQLLEPLDDDYAPEPPKRGRPSRRTPEIVETICALIREEGLSDTAAGGLCGVSSSALSRWKQEDEDFALELEQSRALFERARLREIREARKRDGTHDWRASAWLLQNSSAEGYRRPRKKAEAACGGPRSEGVPPSQVSAPAQTVSLEDVERLVEARLRVILEVLACQKAGASGDRNEEKLPVIPEMPARPAAKLGELEQENPGEGDGHHECENTEPANRPVIPEMPAAPSVESGPNPPMRAAA